MFFHICDVSYGQMICSSCRFVLQAIQFSDVDPKRISFLELFLVIVSSRVKYPHDFKWINIKCFYRDSNPELA